MRNCPNCGCKENKLKIKEEEFLISQCLNCGLVYLLNPPDEKDIYEDYYKIEFTGEDYTLNSKHQFLREIFEINTQRIDLISNSIDDFKQKKFLDIGCGSGLFLQTCKSKGIKAIGIDVSEKALNFAKDSFGVEVYQKSPDELISENKKFDVITLWHVLEHFLNPVVELKKILMLLNNDGKVIIEVPNFNSIKFILSGNKWKGGNHPLYHRSFFTSQTLKNTLELSGFSKVNQINFSYNLKNKSAVYNLSKKFFNTFSADAFLNFIASA